MAPFLDGVQLPSVYTAFSRRKFTFYLKVPRNSWYSPDLPSEDERLSRPWSRPVVWTWDLWIGSPVPQPLGHSYIGDEYKDLIDNIFKSRLRDGDFCLTKTDNHKLALTNIVNNYLEKKLLIWMIDCLILINPLKICQILTIEYIWS